jgi:ribonuclease R
MSKRTPSRNTPRDHHPTEGRPLRDRVLGFLTDHEKPLTVREMVRRLALDAAERGELKPVLRELLASGEVVKPRGSLIGLPSRANLVVGRLTANPAGFGFVVPERKAGARARGGAPEPPKDRSQDVYIAPPNMKEAMHGDRVVAKIERVTSKGAEGHIVRILERSMERLVGRFTPGQKGGGLVIPFDRRVLQELAIPDDATGGAEDGEMVLAEITRPPTATRNPIGRVLEVLGRLDDPGVDVKVVMAKYGLPDAFPEEVEAEAGRVASAVKPEEISSRTDFRPWDTVTVDPETARDHDDAISLDHTPDGGWLLGVHIADVAHYVRPGSALDQEAYLRGTSVYFPDRVVPMLPHALSSHICSLVEGQERLSQTVVLHLDAEGRVKRAEFHDGVILSNAKMSYQQVQKIVDGDVDLRARYASLVPLFERMDALAKLMRKRRYERGSLDFDLPEPKLVLDAAGAMTGIVATERLDSMRMIEEFMLAANEAVAAKLSDAGMPALFRVHEQPDPIRVEEFSELVQSLGYRLPPKTEEIRPEDFQLVLRQIAGKPEEKLVSYLLLRTMRLARYHDENLGHFGLATDMYAHFTSPIRRYPDLVVHRALRAERQGHRDEVMSSLPAPLEEMGLHLSEMERRASDAEREVVEWKKVRFMADKLGEVFTGYITGVQSFGLFVELTEIYVQGLVHISSLADDYYVHNERAHTLKGQNNEQVYRLGDRVEVQVVKVDLERRQLDFALTDVLERTRAGALKERPPQFDSGRPPGRGGRPTRSRTGGGRRPAGTAGAERSRREGPARSHSGRSAKPAPRSRKPGKRGR